MQIIWSLFAWLYYISIFNFKLFQFYLKSCLNQGIFQAESKTAYGVPVHKKGDHQHEKNYRPVFHLPVFSNIFQRLI